MSRTFKRQCAYGAALAACLIGFAVLKGWPGAQSVFAAASVGVLAVYVVRSDEVERTLGVKAGAAAFALLLVAALVLKITAQTERAAALFDDLWAVMVATALLCWVVLRIRLG